MSIGYSDDDIATDRCEIMVIDESHPLIFLHLPKTGGMSFFSQLIQKYGDKTADMYNMSEGRFENAGQLLRDRTKAVFSGHYPFGLHEFMIRPSCYASLVRHPVERILSLFYFLGRDRRIMLMRAQKNGGDENDYFAKDFLPWLKQGDGSLKIFLMCPSAELDNAMVRRFSGIGLKKGPCPEDALQKSKENIAAYFSVVGVLEQMEKTVELFKRTFNWPWFEECHVNIGLYSRVVKEKAPVSDGYRALILKMNSLDMKLYDWVVERFEKQYSYPQPPILVPGGGRIDYEHLRLWKGVGYAWATIRRRWGARISAIS